MIIKELICIGCPLGCNLTVQITDNQEILVSGNTCPRGETYAKKELTDPRRIVTSTVRVDGGATSCVSVKTSTDIPKDKIMECMKELKNVKIIAPVCIGDVIIEDIAGTGVAIVATKNVQKQ